MADGGIDRVLLEARARIGPRVQAQDLQAELDRGSLVVDTRSVGQRSRDGELPGAIVVERNVLEWRLDPTSPHRLPEADVDRRVVVVCDEGYASSLAAASLLAVGLTEVTDLDGGFQAWRRLAQPVAEPPEVGTRPLRP